MKTVSALVISLIVALTGCSATNHRPNSVPSASASKAPVNQWVKACASYKSETGQQYLVAYEEVIADVCSKSNPESRELQYSVSSTVDSQNLMIYLGAEKFFESYWQNYMNVDFPSKRRIVFTELDQDWWKTEATKYLIKPDLNWFTSKNEGGHCRVEEDIYCPKFFEPKLTKTSEPIEFRIIGSKLNWQDWQLLNSAHETVHLYQDSFGMSHWANWYIEGQATFFELAMAQLLFSSDHVRREYLIARPTREDLLRFEPTSVSDVTKFLYKCEHSKNGGCDNFKYGVGSMFHEKLVIDYGLKKYFEWQKFLIKNMPQGNPGAMTALQQSALAKKFDQSFVQVFGIEREHWIESVLAPYLLDYFG